MYLPVVLGLAADEELSTKKNVLSFADAGTGIPF